MHLGLNEKGRPSVEVGVAIVAAVVVVKCRTTVGALSEMLPIPLLERWQIPQSEMKEKVEGRDLVSEALGCIWGEARPVLKPWVPLQQGLSPTSGSFGLKGWSRVAFKPAPGRELTSSGECLL